MIELTTGVTSRRQKRILWQDRVYIQCAYEAEDGKIEGVVALVSVLPVHAFNYTGTYSAINVTNVIVPQLYGNSTIDVTYNFSVLNAPATVYVPIPGNAYNIQFYANGVQTPIRETTTGNHTLVAISGINVQQPLTLSFSYKTDIPSSGNIFNYTFPAALFKQQPYFPLYSVALELV